jgi:hypothetical protein
MTDREFLFAYDLQGRDVTVTISRVVAGQLTDQNGRKSKKPVVFFEGKDKGLALNSTNAKTIAALYGNYVEAWVGKSITIYPTTTKMAGEVVECIRVRPKVAAAQVAGKRDVAEQIREEMGK